METIREGLVPSSTDKPLIDESVRVWLREARSTFGMMTVGSLLQRSAVKELTSGSSSLILPRLVDARASIKFQTLVQADEVARIQNVPEGTGKTFDIQRIANLSYDTFTEGTAPTATDPTLGNPQGTMAQLGKMTKITSFLQRTSAVDFVNAIGEAHGSTVQGAINDKIWTELKAATTSVINTAEGALTEGTITLTLLRNAKRAIEVQKWPPADYIVTGPRKFYQFLTDGLPLSATATPMQFSGAMSEFLRTGGITTFLGLRWIVDTVFGDPTAGAAGEDYAALGVMGTSVAWGQLGPKIRSEVWREGREISDYIVSYVEGGAKIVEEDSTATISHS